MYSLFRVRPSVARPCRVSKRISAATQLVLYPTPDQSAGDADACIARLSCVPRLAARVTMPAPRLLTRVRRVLRARWYSVPRLTLIADTLTYAFFHNFLAASAPVRLTYLVLPHFVGALPAPFEVPSAATPPCWIAALASHHRSFSVVRSAA